mmetsp:Transcript_12900/g.37883  ORF Transcript_12900/g.37883 Transcript_12900/m.37883 type:complete len:274 (-) Transcript_12900:1322-2143(-)
MSSWYTMERAILSRILRMRPGTLAKAMTVFDAEDDLDISALEKACKQAARPSQDLADWTMLALREEDRVEVICAPFEADAQVAAEATRRREMKPGRRVVVLASSLDGDIPLYPGVGEVVFWRPGTSEKKAQIVTVGANPPARLKVAKGRTYDFSGWSWGAFILLLIAGGCDYVGNLNNVGIPTLYDTLQPYMRANHFSASACRPYDLLMLLVRTHKALDRGMGTAGEKRVDVIPPPSSLQMATIPRRDRPGCRRIFPGYPHALGCAQHRFCLG